MPGRKAIIHSGTDLRTVVTCQELLFMEGVSQVTGASKENMMIFRDFTAASLAHIRFRFMQSTGVYKQVII